MPLNKDDLISNSDGRLGKYEIRPCCDDPDTTTIYMKEAEDGTMFVTWYCHNCKKSGTDEV